MACNFQDETNGLHLVTGIITSLRKLKKISSCDSGFPISLTCLSCHLFFTWIYLACLTFFHCASCFAIFSCTLPKFSYRYTTRNSLTSGTSALTVCWTELCRFFREVNQQWTVLVDDKTQLQFHITLCIGKCTEQNHLCIRWVLKECFHLTKVKK